MAISGCVKTLQSLVIHSHGGLNRRVRRKKYAIKYSQSSFCFTNKINREDIIISNRNSKAFNKYRVPVTLKDGYASKSEDDDGNIKSFQNVLLKNLNALYRFIRPYACAGVVSCLLISYYLLQKQCIHV